MAKNTPPQGVQGTTQGHIDNSVVEYQKISENLNAYHLNFKNLSDDERKIVMNLWAEFINSMTLCAEYSNYMPLNVKRSIVLFKTLTLNGYLVTLREKNIDEIIN